MAYTVNGRRRGDGLGEAFMLMQSPEYLKRQTAPSASTEPLAKPVEEGDSVTDPNLSMQPSTGRPPEEESIVSVAPRRLVSAGPK